MAKTSIKNRLQFYFSLLAGASILAISIISIVGLVWSSSTIQREMQSAEEEINKTTSTQAQELNFLLAESYSNSDAEKLNADFNRVGTELLNVAANVEHLYASGGLEADPQVMRRTSEYIISKAASVTPAEQAETVRRFRGITNIFDVLLKNEKTVSLAYVVLDNGMAFSSTESFYPKVENADMRTRDWYKNARDKGALCWSSVYKGTDNRSYVTVSMPIYHGQDFIGVAAFDMRVSEISNVIFSKQRSNVEYAFIVDKEMQPLFSSNEKVLEALDPEVKAVVERIRNMNLSSGYVQQGKTIVGYAKISTTGWYLINKLSYDAIQEPVKAVSDTVASTANKMADSSKQQILAVIALVVVALVALIAVAAYLARTLAKRLSAPIMQLEEGVSAISKGKLDYKIDLHTEDEIEELANSFNMMGTNLVNLIDNLKTVTAEKERIGAELDVANHIQASMLPCIFPPFPDKPELDIYASMRPAKFVGGDFYDFFLIDDDHLAMVMADVSGKGIPAALFMVISKTLLKNVALTGASPHEILEQVNNQLCVNNTAEMFVTVWLGILEISTGKMVCANAGHEYPIVRHADGSFELIKDKHGFVLAGMENMRYKEYELKLDEGETIFVYTDGVAEATDAHNELYGTERLLDCLNGTESKSSQQSRDFIEAVQKDVDDFVGEAPQFDDITMLSVGRRPIKRLQLKPTSENYQSYLDFCEESLTEFGMPLKQVMKINVCLDELLSNVMNYSEAEWAELSLIKVDKEIELCLKDTGKPFDPTKQADADTTLSAEERAIGGLGITMVRKMTTSFSYQRFDGKNIVRLRFAAAD